MHFENAHYIVRIYVYYDRRGYIDTFNHAWIVGVFVSFVVRNC